jgi:hypothetical protein
MGQPGPRPGHRNLPGASRAAPMPARSGCFHLSSSPSRRTATCSSRPRHLHCAQGGPAGRPGEVAARRQVLQLRRGLWRHLLVAAPATRSATASAAAASPCSPGSAAGSRTLRAGPGGVRGAGLQLPRRAGGVHRGAADLRLAAGRRVADALRLVPGGQRRRRDRLGGRDHLPDLVPGRGRRTVAVTVVLARADRRGRAGLVVSLLVRRKPGS